MRGRSNFGLSWFCLLLTGLGCAERSAASSSSGVLHGVAGAAAAHPGDSSRPHQASGQFRSDPRDFAAYDDSGFEVVGAPAELPPPTPDPTASGTTDDQARVIRCVNKTGFAADTTTLHTLAELVPPRQFHVRVPKSYDATVGVPLVIDLHGLGGSAHGEHPGSQPTISGWRAKGEVENFITVHPVGLDAAWNGGVCCAPATLNRTDDVAFLRAIVKKVADIGCIDASQVYATGLGNGGALAHRLGCEASDVFSGVAPISMGYRFTDCTPQRAISVVMFRGTEDRTVPYHESIFSGAKSDLQNWAQLQGCSGQPVRSDMDRCETYSECRAGVSVTLCSPQAGNVLYRDAAQQGIAVPDIAWNVFKLQPR